MKVLVVGSGGREHALAWKVAQSSKLDQLFIAPGNPGTAALGTNVDLQADDVAGLLEFAQKNTIDLCIVGPEIPLTLGITDAFNNAGLRCFGPSRAASELEGSKVAMKEFLRSYNIPTAPFQVFDDAQKAHEHIDMVGAPIVIKCDGLAAGKGVTVAETDEEAHLAITRIMEDCVFGAEAGKYLVIEEILRGEEISVFAFCDGHNAVLLDYAQDHKQAYDGDIGPNTGGMGAFTPAPGLLSDKDEDEVVRRIVVPTMSGLVKENRPYVGILYMGLMVTNTGPKVIEYNVRFGDPECQALMLRLETDMLDICNACVDGNLDSLELSWKKDTAICVTMASGGYPEAYEKGKRISGLDDFDHVQIFHAGTAEKDGEIVSAGGRVLSVTALGSDLNQARERAYAVCDSIHFEGKHLRRDIGTRCEARKGN
ncbi:MAG: phosphoribosylamine--glycine ligase [Planctomycetes bacterium]|nr:phosphoribosylamine--glycine ligase [Planctomycetota bacterium]